MMAESCIVYTLHSFMTNKALVSTVKVREQMTTIFGHGYRQKGGMKNRCVTYSPSKNSLSRKQR